MRAGQVVRKTLDGAVHSIGHRTRDVSIALVAPGEDRGPAARRRGQGLRRQPGRSSRRLRQDGTLLRGEVLARWQEFVGTGELMRSLEDKVGRIRDRLLSAARGAPQPAQKLTVAVESGLQTLIVEHAESAAERAALAWRSLPAGAQLLEEAPGDIARASRDFRPRAERPCATGSGAVLDLVRDEGADRRATARFLAFGVNGLGVALMMVVFAQTAGLTGAEVGVAGGTAVVGQSILEAVFGDHAVRRLVRDGQPRAAPSVSRRALWHAGAAALPRHTGRECGPARAPPTSCSRCRARLTTPMGWRQRHERRGRDAAPADRPQV